MGSHGGNGDIKEKNVQVTPDVARINAWGREGTIARVRRGTRDR